MARDESEKSHSGGDRVGRGGEGRVKEEEGKRRERSGRGREKPRGIRLPWGRVGTGEATSTFQKGHPRRGGGLGDLSLRPPSPRVSLSTPAPCPPACAPRRVPASAGEALPAPAPPCAPRPPRPCLCHGGGPGGSPGGRGGYGAEGMGGWEGREGSLPSAPTPALGASGACGGPAPGRAPPLRPAPARGSHPMRLLRPFGGPSPLQSRGGRPSRLVRRPAPGPVARREPAALPPARRAAGRLGSG